LFIHRGCASSFVVGDALRLGTRVDVFMFVTLVDVFMVVDFVDVFCVTLRVKNTCTHHQHDKRTAANGDNAAPSASGELTASIRSRTSPRSRSYHLARAVRGACVAQLRAARAADRLHIHTHAVNVQHLTSTRRTRAPDAGDVLRSFCANSDSMRAIADGGECDNTDDDSGGGDVDCVAASTDVVLTAADVVAIIGVVGVRFALHNEHVVSTVHRSRAAYRTSMCCCWSVSTDHAATLLSTWTVHK
jgi:hypothetical protein